MRFEPNMCLVELAGEMGPQATQQDTAIMRDLLLKTGYKAIEEIPENVWIACMEQVADRLYGPSKAHRAAILGADYLAFVHDPEFWPNIDQAETYAEGVVIEVDGKVYEQPDIESTTITHNSLVTIIAGDVFQFMTPLHTMQDHYEAWSAARRKVDG